ncbi:MAG: mechanosensitive ion channel family protein [Limisphaerales bacterium]
MSILTRIWLPATVFAVFLLALFNRQELVDRFLENANFLTRNFVEYGVQIGVWLSAAFLMNRMIGVLFWDGFIGRLSDRPVPRLPRDLSAMVLFSVAVLAIISTVFQRDITSMLAASGVFGVIIGLALRTVILDLFMGLAIHIERPFKIGDWLMIHQNRVETHIIAEVIEINWRTTRLRTTRNNMVVVPNSKMGDTIVTNYMEPKPHFRIDLDFTIDFEVPSERVLRVMTAGLKAVTDGEGILDDPVAEVRIKDSTLEGAEYEVRFFILPAKISPNEARHVVNRSVLEHLIHSGITPAHAKEEIFLQRRERRALDASLDEDLYQLLTRTELFRKLNAAEFAAVFREMRKRDLTEGETLYAQGDAGDSMFICVEGLLASAITVRGQGEVKVETLRAGQHFGEGTIFKATSRSTTVTAEADSLVYEIERHVIEPLLDVRLDLREQLKKGLKQQTDRIKDSWKEARRKKAEDQPKKTVRKSSVKKVVQAFFPGMFEGAKESQEKSTNEK